MKTINVCRKCPYGDLFLLAGAARIKEMVATIKINHPDAIKNADVLAWASKDCRWAYENALGEIQNVETAFITADLSGFLKAMDSFADAVELIYSEYAAVFDGSKENRTVRKKP